MSYLFFSFYCTWYRYPIKTAHIIIETDNLIIVLYCEQIIPRKNRSRNWTEAKREQVNKKTIGFASW